MDHSYIFIDTCSRCHRETRVRSVKGEYGLICFRCLPDKNNTTVFVEKNSPNAILPRKATPGSANFDIFSLEDTVIHPHEIVPVRTGLKIELPPMKVLEIYPRSGMALKYGITVLNSPGQIDSDYRDEIKVILYNIGYLKEPYIIKYGDRIAQCRIQTVEPFHFIEDKIDMTRNRGGGFGSTGN